MTVSTRLHTLFTARLDAAKLGHRMEPWRHGECASVAGCRRCRMLAVVFWPQEKRGGFALLAACPARPWWRRLLARWWR